MLWYKSWLDTRSRFLIGLAVMMLAAAGAVIAYPRVMKLMPLASTVDTSGELGRRIREGAELMRSYRGYVWGQFVRQSLTQMGTLFAVLLGSGGLLSNTSDAGDREAIALALTGICGRSGTRSLTHVLPLAKNNDSELRKIALRALATMGGPDALAAVSKAVEDRDESVQDEAVGTLATWPNNWPEDAAVAEPLLGLVKSGRKRSYQVQGARGYLLYVQENKKLSNADKLSAIDNLLPLLQQPQEKRLAISTLGSIPTAGALESLGALAADPAVAEEACLAIVNVATAKSLERTSKDVRQKALQTAIDKSKNDSTRNKAGEALKTIQ